MKAATPDEQVSIGSPSADRSGRFREDFMSRWAGFQIYSRRKGKPAVWAKGGALYHESEAYKIAREMYQEALCTGK